MSSQRFAPEFKDEAVRQVLERGYPVTEVAQRLGVSAHSLYKWIKAVKPNKTDQQASELVEAKSEILRLRAQQAATGVHSRKAGPGVGDRHHVHTDVAGLALPRRGDGPLCSTHRWLVDEADARA